MGSSEAGYHVMRKDEKNTEEIDRPVDEAGSEAPETGESEDQESYSQADSSTASEKMVNGEHKRGTKSANQQFLIEVGTSLVIGAIALAVSWYTARMMDPSRSANPKKAKEKKRMIRERLGKKIETNQYVPEKLIKDRVKVFDEYKIFCCAGMRI